jgi:hypothetical protein
MYIAMVCLTNAVIWHYVQKWLDKKYGSGTNAI